MDLDCEQILNEHRLSVTAARKAILWAVVSYPHSDADKILKYALKKSGSLSKQAVYDNLRVLTEKGIVRTIQPMGHPARFELDYKDNHHHIVCRSCGVAMDVHCKSGMEKLVPKENHGFVVDEAEVTFWGVCPQCQIIESSKKKGKKYGSQKSSKQR